MPLLQKGTLFWLLTFTFFASCQKELTCVDCYSANSTRINRPPIANAGTDQTVSITTHQFNLDGSLSTDPDNNITGYTWTSVGSSPVATMADANAVQTGVTGFVEGTYQFELKVTDSEGLFAKDTIAVIINNFNQATPGWTKLRPVPPDDFFVGGNRINFLIGIQDKVFAVSKIGTFWYYNLQENTWSKKGQLPTENASLNFSVVFSINNVGYVIGNGTSRQYDVLTNQWTTKNNAPVGPNHVDYSSPLIIGNKAYLVGSTNSQVTEYDPLTDTYTLKNRFPGVAPETGFVIDGEGYCIQKDGKCWKYDLLADTWQQKSGLPTSLFNKSGFSLNGFGYIITDSNHTASNQNLRMKVWRYSPSADKWKQMDDDYPGQAAYEVRAVSVNGTVYAGLGYTSENKDALDFWSFK